VAPPPDGPVDPRVTGPVWTVPLEPDALFPPPTWTVPIEFVAPLPPFPPTATVSEAVIEPTGVWLLTAGVAWGPADCTLPSDPAALLPPPIWTVPAELEALLLPAPPAEAGAVTVVLSTLAATAALGAPDCTVPAELEALFPPPI
jgi:hypothetical protein